MAAKDVKFSEIASASNLADLELIAAFLSNAGSDSRSALYRWWSNSCVVLAS
jgi:hypothetical protein